MKDFEMLPHTADIKLRVYGKDLPDLFRNALIGMFQSIRPVAPGCREHEGRIVCDKLPIQREVTVAADDIALLLVDFLSEALYLSDVHNEAYFDADVRIEGNSVEATIKGIPVTGFEVVEIKAVTYHDLEVKQTDDGWQAEIVFDI